MSNDISQFYGRNNGTDFPFISVPDTDWRVKSLVADLFLYVPYSTDFSDVGNVPVISSFEFSAGGIDLIAESGIHTLIDTEDSGATVETDTYGSYTTYFFTNTDNGCSVSVVINTNSDVFQDDDYFTVSNDLRIHSRCFASGLRTVNSINNGTQSIIFKAGTNIQLSTEGNRIHLNAVPGAGTGRQDVEIEEGCEEVSARAFNGLVPDSKGNVNIYGDDNGCLWSEYDADSTLYLNDNCNPCLTCDDIVGLSKSLKGIYDGTNTSGDNVPLTPLSRDLDKSWTAVGSLSSNLQATAPGGATYRYNHEDDPALDLVWPVTGDVVFAGNFSKDLLEVTSTGIWWLGDSSAPSDAVINFTGSIVGYSSYSAVQDRYNAIVNKYLSILEVVKFFNNEIDSPRAAVEAEPVPSIGGLTLLVRGWSGSVPGLAINTVVSHSVLSNSQAGNLAPELVISSGKTFTKDHNAPFQKITDNSLIDIDGFDDTLAGERLSKIWYWALEVNPNITDDDFGSEDAASISMELNVSITADCPAGTDGTSEALPSVDKTFIIEFTVEPDGFIEINNIDTNE